MENTIDIIWAKEEMKKTGRNKCNRDFIYYNIDSNGNIFYRDLSNLPRKSNGRYIDWKKTNNNDIKIYVYGAIYNCKISFKEYRGSHNIVLIEYKDKSKEISVSHLCTRSQESFLNKKKPHNYIPKKGNSLLEKEPWLKDYVKNPEILSEYSTRSGKYLELVCPECKGEIKRKVYVLMRDSFKCPYCGSGTSYPEKFLMAYFKCKNIKFEHQKIEKTLKNRRFDFYLPEEDIYIEAHGMQHYNENKIWYKNTLEQDVAKREWSNKNSKTLIEIDCRYSEYEFIRNSINTSILDSISDFEEKYIKDEIVNLSSYDFKHISELYEKYKSSYIVSNITDINQRTILDCLRKIGVDTSNKGLTGKKQIDDSIIIDLYKNEKSIYKVSAILKYSSSSVCRVLEDNNIVKRGNFVQVRCINTGRVFPSIKDGATWCGLKTSFNISTVCNGKRNSAGKHPETGEPLRWEYVD